MLKFKKTFAVLGTLALALTLASCGGKSDADLEKEGWVKNPAENGWVEAPLDNGYVKEPGVLPIPVDPTKKNSEGKACKVGDFGNECASINKDNLGSYMNRTDVVYIDLRGAGRGYLGEHVKGFESVEFFDYIWGDEEQLYTKDNAPRYEESEQIVNTLFPKNKSLFLMCQGGARVETMMALLDAIGYDMNKVYNVSGMNQLHDKTSTVKDLVVKAGTPNSEVNYFPKNEAGELIGLTPIK